MSIDLVIGLYDGFHMGGELRMLNRIADGITEGIIVSIGSYRGQMDCALAMHAHVPVCCIDPRTPSDNYPFSDDDRQHWMTNVLAMGVAGKVRPINLPSLTVASTWTEPISLLFIDGDHAQVQADLDAWLPHVMDGGLVAFHDIYDAGITATIAGSDGLVEIERCDLTAVFRKGNVPVAETKYERYEYNGLTLEVRLGVYNAVDRFVCREVQDYQLPDTPLRTVIDAGAMIGAFTAWVKHLYPDALVLAIEPEPGNLELLIRNVDDNGVIIRRGALSYDTARNTLAIDGANSGGHRLIYVNHGDTVDGLVINEIDCYTLEDLMIGHLKYIDLLKLDVEGSEMDVLLSAEDDTLRRIHHIVGERHFTHEQFIPVITRLEALGFTVEDKPHPILSVEPWEMSDRGLFTATNNNWTEPPPVEVAEPKPAVKRKPGRKAKAK